MAEPVPAFSRGGLPALRFIANGPHGVGALGTMRRQLPHQAVEFNESAREPRRRTPSFWDRFMAPREGNFLKMTGCKELFWECKQVKYPTSDDAPECISMHICAGKAGGKL